MEKQELICDPVVAGGEVLGYQSRTAGGSICSWDAGGFMTWDKAPFPLALLWCMPMVGGSKLKVGLQGRSEGCWKLLSFRLSSFDLCVIDLGF